MAKRQHAVQARQRRAGNRSPAAFSLLEMIFASALVAGTLAPALAVMRDAMALSRDAACRNRLAVFAVRSLESGVGTTMRTWTNGTSVGSFAADGCSNIRYVLVRSDNPSDGGLVNRLMHLHATVYEDANGNSALDADETKVVFRTKVARLSNFQNAPL